MGNTKKEKQQLGMSYGRARSRLWALLLLKMARDLGCDNCFRCGGLIKTVDEFSVDHKQPWLDISSDLFWDLENIAFSHRSCNGKAARRNPVANREGLRRYWMKTNQAPEGTSWCFGCRAFVNKQEFNVNRHRFSGVQKYCKVCRARGVGRHKQWHQNMPTVEKLRAVLEEYDYRRAGDILGVSHMTVKAWAKEFGLLDIRRNKRFADIAQLVEHSLGKGEVTGSFPVVGSILR